MIDGEILLDHTTILMVPECMDVGWLMTYQSNLLHHAESSQHTYIHTHIYIYIYMYSIYIIFITWLCIHVCMCINIKINIYIYICVCVSSRFLKTNVLSQYVIIISDVFWMHPPVAEELPAPHGASPYGRVAGALAPRSAAPGLRGEVKSVDQGGGEGSGENYTLKSWWLIWTIINHH